MSVNHQGYASQYSVKALKLYNLLIGIREYGITNAMSYTLNKSYKNTKHEERT